MSLVYTVDENSCEKHIFEELKEQDRSFNNQRAFHTPNSRQKVMGKARLDLYTVKNLGPSGSKCKVSKVKRNRSIMKSYRNCNGSG